MKEQMTPVADSKHNELRTLLTPLIDFMIANDYHYFLVVGKDGVCSRHMSGHIDDLSGMLEGMAEHNEDVKGLLQYVNENLK